MELAVNEGWCCGGGWILVMRKISDGVKRITFS